MAYVLDNVDDQDLESTPVDPKSKPKPKAKPKAALKKGSAKDADGDANGGGRIVPQSTPTKTPTKRDRSPTDESAAGSADGQATRSMESQNVTSSGSGSQASQARTDWSISRNWSVVVPHNLLRARRPRREKRWAIRGASDLMATAMMRNWWQSYAMSPSSCSEQ